MKTIAEKNSARSQMNVAASVDVSRDEVKKSFIPALFAVSLILPNFFHVGSLRLAPYLLVLLLLIIPMFVQFLNRRAGPMMLPDFLILFYCIWCSLSLMVIHGVVEALEPAGIIWVQTCGAYLIGRLFVRNVDGLRSVLHIFCIIIIFMLPFAIMETLTARPVYLDVFSKLGPVYDHMQKNPRWGFDRVQAAFEHPILFGIYSSSLFALAYYGLKRGLVRLGMLSLIIVSTVVSLSTGALVCIGVQMGLIAWNWIFRSYQHRWRNLTAVLVTSYVVVDVLSNRNPFDVFVSYLTFNATNSYNRILIWKYGTAEVLRHPVFGIGINEWERPWFMSSSMDNFWLVGAVQNGLPAFLALSVAVFVVMKRAGRNDKLRTESQGFRDGLVMSLVGVSVAICSAHLWHATYCWFLFLVGSCVFLHKNPADVEALAIIKEPVKKDTSLTGNLSPGEAPSPRIRSLKDLRAVRSNTKAGLLGKRNIDQELR